MYFSGQMIPDQVCFSDIESWTGLNDSGSTENMRLVKYLSRGQASGMVIMNMVTIWYFL